MNQRNSVPTRTPSSFQEHPKELRAEATTYNARFQGGRYHFESEQEKKKIGACLIIFCKYFVTDRSVSSCTQRSMQSCDDETYTSIPRRKTESNFKDYEKKAPRLTVGSIKLLVFALILIDGSASLRSTRFQRFRKLLATFWATVSRSNALEA